MAIKWWFDLSTGWHENTTRGQMPIQHLECIRVWCNTNYYSTLGFNIIWKYKRKAISSFTKLYINVFINVFDAVVSVVSAKLRTSGKKMIKISQFGVSVTRETMAKPQIIISYSQMIHLLIIDRLSSFWVHLYFITEFLRLRLFGRLLWLIWHLREGRRPMVTPCAINYGRDVNDLVWVHPMINLHLLPTTGNVKVIKDYFWNHSVEQARSDFGLNTYPISTPHTNSSVEEMRFSTVALYVIYRASILIS